MNLNRIKSFSKYALIALGMVLVVSSCSKKEDAVDVGVKVLDGTYIKGAGTALVDLKSTGKMTLARNEVLQTERATLYEMYVAVKKGAEGFNIVTVNGAEQKTYGPAATGFGEVLVANRNVDEPKDGSLQKGAVIETTNKFTVPEDGLYHVVFESGLKKVSIAKVVWGVIGAATPGGWGSSTALPMSGAFDLNKITFEAKNVKLEKGDFKYRYSNGWKIILDETLDLGAGKKGVNVNTNFGGKLDALIAGGDNMSNLVRGYYTLTFVWELGKAPVVTVLKTADVPVIDYTSYSMGIIGNVYQKADGVQASWDENLLPSTPTKAGTIYTWNYAGVKLTKDAAAAADFKPEFKFRQGADWNGKSIGFNDVVLKGTAAANIENDGGNFMFKVGVVYAGTYNIKLEIDAATEVYTVTIDKI